MRRGEVRRVRRGYGNGSPSRLSSHSPWTPDTPVRAPTIPPVMAHVVSTSPNPSAVDHSAAVRSSGWRAAVHTANGTVSSARIR